MREAWRELMVADTDQAAKATQGPVAPAGRSPQAQRKVSSKPLDGEQPVRSFATLMAGWPPSCATPAARSAGADAP